MSFGLPCALIFGIVEPLNFIVIFAVGDAFIDYFFNSILFGHVCFVLLSFLDVLKSRCILISSCSASTIIQQKSRLACFVE